MHCPVLISPLAPHLHRVMNSVAQGGDFFQQSYGAQSESPPQTGGRLKLSPRKQPPANIKNMSFTVHPSVVRTQATSSIDV